MSALGQKQTLERISIGAVFGPRIEGGGGTHPTEEDLHRRESRCSHSGKPTLVTAAGTAPATFENSLDKLLRLPFVV
jgi:hypothetical protein